MDVLVDLRALPFFASRREMQRLSRIQLTDLPSVEQLKAQQPRFACSFSPTKPRP